MSGTLDVSVINPFLTATIDIFRSMFSLGAQSGPPFLLEEKTIHRWEISGILGVTGDYYGLVCIRLHKILANKLLEKSGVAIFSEKERLETVNGLIGEMTNIISGNAATLIQHAHLEISPPAVIIGKNHQISWPSNIPVIGIPFSTSNGPFEVDVCFRGKAIG